MPTTVDLHTDPATIERWVEYATFDSEATYYLHHVLRALMKDLPVNFEGMRTIEHIYDRYWLPFGELLTDIESTGIRVNVEHLRVS